MENKRANNLHKLNIRLFQFCEFRKTIQKNKQAKTFLMYKNCGLAIALIMLLILLFRLCISNGKYSRSIGLFLNKTF